MADTVTRTVSVVETVLPERFARPRVEEVARCGLGEDGLVDRDMTLQDASVRSLLEGRGRAVVERAGDTVGARSAGGGEPGEEDVLTR